MSTLKHRRLAASPRCLIRIGLACNDDHGLFYGRVDSITVSTKEQHIELEPTSCRPPKLTLHDDSLRIFRRTFDFVSSKEWVGNWCWNDYIMSLDTASRFVDRAIRAGFSATGSSGNAACDLSDYLQGGRVAGPIIRDYLLKMSIDA
jgi:hypothetical protein